jgi:uncharacterized integral membrane protein
MSAPAQTPGQHDAQHRTRRERARTGALVLLAVVATLFAVLNFHDVKVHWIFGTSETPLTLVIVISLLIGIVFTYFAGRHASRKG